MICKAQVTISFQHVPTAAREPMRDKSTMTFKWAPKYLNIFFSHCQIVFWMLLDGNNSSKKLIEIGYMKYYIILL